MLDSIAQGDVEGGFDIGDVIAQIRDYAIIALDPQGTIASWNAGAERLKGYTADEAIDRHFSMFYTDDDRAAGLPAQLLERAERDGAVFHAGWRVRKDGTRFWGEVNITALHDAAGTLTGFAKVTRDRTEHHDLELALQRSEERLRFLISQVSDYAIVALDPQGTITSWNAGAERVKGYRSDEAIGRHFSIFYTKADRRAGLPAAMLAKARDHGSVSDTGWRVRKDGSQFWGEVSITALHDDAGRLTGYAKVTRDRSEVKALEEAQDSFYAAFRHDFATPIFALQLALDSIRDGILDSAERSDSTEHAERDSRHNLLQLVDRAEANVNRLERMTRDLIGFAQLRAGKAALRLEAVDIVATTHEAIGSLPELDAAARVRIGTAAPVPPVKADRGALARVLVNLFTNALKYSPGDSPVDVRYAVDHGNLLIRVADAGRGIHTDDLNTIFDEFERGQLAENDGGTGLGLASVKALVLQQYGDVHIDSEVGTGTTVTVRLPLA